MQLVVSSEYLCDFAQLSQALSPHWTQWLVSDFAMNVCKIKGQDVLIAKKFSD